MYDSENLKRRRFRRTPVMEEEFEDDFLEEEERPSDVRIDISDAEDDYDEYEEIEPRVLSNRRSERSERNAEPVERPVERAERTIERFERPERSEQRQAERPERVEQRQTERPERTKRTAAVRAERTPRAASRTERKERSSRASSEDAFYAQMETLRQRSLQMQQLLGEKQDEVDYLEELLDDLEEQNQLLQDELEASRKQSGDFAEDLAFQVNKLSEILGADLEEMEERITEQIESIPVAGTDQMQEITFDTDSITDSFSDSFDIHSKKLDQTFASISDKLEDIIENQKSLIESGREETSDPRLDTIIEGQNKLLENQGKGGVAESTRDELNEIFSDQQNFISTSMLTQEKKINDSLRGMESGLEGMKNELSDKIHSEDVKVYRNLQDFIKEQDHHEEDSKILEARYKSLRNREYINMVLTIINIILGAFFLYIIS